MTRNPLTLIAASAAAATRGPGMRPARSEDALATPRRRWHCLPIAASALGLAAVGLQSQEARGAIMITVSQQGANVVINFSGSWDNWTAPGGGTISTSNTPYEAVYGLGMLNLPDTSQKDFWSGTGAGLTLTSGLWTAVPTNADSTSGDNFGWTDTFTYAPLGYEAGDPISGSLTFNNTDLVTMGFTPGDSGFFSGGAGTLLFSVEATAVPGAGLAGLATIGLAGISRRRRR